MTIPEGWKLVPDAITPEMIRAALSTQWPALYRDSIYADTDGENLRIETRKRVERVIDQYNAMLAASPAEPAQSEKFLPCPICSGIEGCDHTYPERQRAAIRHAALHEAALVCDQRAAVPEGGWHTATTREASVCASKILALV